MDEGTEEVILSVADTYGILREVITRGIYMVRVPLPGVPIVLRVLPEQELDFLLSGCDKKDAIVQILAGAMVMAGGVDFLSMERYKGIEEARRLLLDASPRALRGILGSAYSEAYERYMVASSNIEGFCNTRYSRRLWQSRTPGDPYAPRHTGIIASPNIPLMPASIYWIGHNTSLTLREERRWQNSLAILPISGHPGGHKAVKGHFDHDERLREHEEEERVRLAEAGSRRALVEANVQNNDGWAQPISTTEELLAEMRRNSAGLKDKHDLFVESYFREKRDRKIREQQEALAKAERAREEAEALKALSKERRLDLESPVELGLTEEQLRKRRLAKASKGNTNLIRRGRRILGD